MVVASALGLAFALGLVVVAFALGGSSDSSLCVEFSGRAYHIVVLSLVDSPLLMTALSATFFLFWSSSSLIASWRRAFNHNVVSATRVCASKPNVCTSFETSLLLLA